MLYFVKWNRSESILKLVKKLFVSMFTNQKDCLPMITQVQSSQFCRMGLLLSLVFSATLIVGCQDTTPPGQVTGFIATAGNGQVVLVWTNPTDEDLAAIKILRKTGTPPTLPTDGTLVYEGLATTYTDTGLVNGETYFYAAFSLDAKGNYAPPVLVSAIPVGDTTPPGPVTNFSATGGDAQVALAWVNPVDADFEGVKIVRKQGSVPLSITDGVVVYDDSGTGTTDTDVMNGLTYFYAAYAYDGAGNLSGAVSASATPMGDTTPPGPVTNFTATAGDGEVLLAWVNPGDSDFAGVKIQRKTGAPAASPEDGTTAYNGPGTAHTDTTVANGTQYYYTAYAYDGVGNYAEGVDATATPTSENALQDILDDLDELSQLVEEDPEQVLTEVDKTELLEILAEADGKYRGGDPCGASEVLRSKFLTKAQLIRVGIAIGVAEELYNIGRMIRFNMVGTLEDPGACPGAERIGQEADAEVEEESNQGVGLRAVFGEPLFQTLREDDGMPQGVFSQLHLPGAESAQGQPGAPAVPIFRRLLAAPRGAVVEVGFGKAEPEVAEEIFLNLYPVREEPVDDKPDPSVFEDKPFMQDARIYGSDTPYPLEVASLLYLGDARDLDYYLLEIAGGQYQPLSNRLILYKAMDISVRFRGGSGNFVTEGMLNPFESSTPVFTDAVLNNKSLLIHVEGILKPVLSGEELMILTHPNFNDAAIALRDWKRTKGIWTNVYQCGTGSGITGRQTRDEIRTFIHDHYSSVYIRPSYILLLGDAEFIAPFYVNSIGTDWPYAILGAVGVDKIPDFAVGRIPVDTLAQANTVVNKIINYEKTPPISPAFYSRAAIAAQFQCCRDGAAAGTDQRTFIEVSEFARNVMTSAGKTVDRIYMQTNATATPTRYYNGTLLPTALGSSSGFAWSGSTNDITNAWNAGRFLVMHRDHGWEGGWSHPEYELPDIDSLTNDKLLPVVFSVNCASGFFDNETAGGAYGTTASGIYFCEKLLRKADGGAVGILGDTRNSPSWANSTLTQGFFDAIWPNAIGSFGGTKAHRRLGDILNHGKLYLMSKVGVSVMGVVIDNSSAVDELYLWHVLGDPTLEIWTSNPNLISLPVKVAFQYLDLFDLNQARYARGINVEYMGDGSVITMYEERLRKQLVPIGRGVVKNGMANIRFLEDHDISAPLTFIANFENAAAKILEAKKMN